MGEAGRVMGAGCTQGREEVTVCLLLCFQRWARMRPVPIDWYVPRYRPCTDRHDGRMAAAGYSFYCLCDSFSLVLYSVFARSPLLPCSDFLVPILLLMCVMRGCEEE